jgi:hypothetical protein
MKRTISAGILAALCGVWLLPLHSPAQDQPTRDRAAWGRDSEFARIYDPETVETITGDVLEVAYFTPRRAGGRGLHISLKSETETIPIHLGPEWFLENQELQLAVNDKLTVTGSRVTYDGKPAIIAGEVRKGDQVLELRDDRGIPRWAASRHARPHRAGREGRAERGSGGWGPRSPYCGLFDPKTVETVTGEVVDVAYFTPRKTVGRGVHLTLKTEHETIAVHLGPEWFLDKQDVQIEPRDKITVTASRVSFEEHPVLIASEITKGEDVLELRDKNGIPSWAGWRRAGPKH